MNGFIKLKSVLASRIWHIYILAALGVAHPLLELLAKNPEYFVVKGTQPIDLLALPAMLFIGLPTLLVLLVWIAGRIAPSAGRFCFNLIFFLLVLCTALIAANRILGFSILLMALSACILAAAVVAGYKKFHSIEVFFTFLLPALIVLPLFFFMQESIQKLAFSREYFHAQPNFDAKFPIVMVTFDEFPLVSLLDGNKQIDATNFPNFARLASTSTWYRNATTVSDNTGPAMIAMLTGRYPISDLYAFVDYPKNLFTLVGKSYEMNVTEAVTALCPQEICKSKSAPPFLKRMADNVKDLSAVYPHLLLPEALAERFLPPITLGWEGFWDWGGDRSGDFDRFVQSIAPGKRQGFHYFHSELPHRGYDYLPSGKTHTSESLKRLREEITSKCTGNHGDLFHTELQFLQVAFVDRLLGRLIDRLKATGLYDQSLLVVTADHGVCLRSEEKIRELTRTNFEDILLIPLFIKTPGQTKPLIVDRNVETIDVFPTIAGLLGIRADQVAGVSLLDPTIAERKEKRATLKGSYQAFPPSVNPSVVTMKLREELRRAGFLNAAAYQ